MEKLLKVVAIDILFSDKAQCNFKKVTFEGYKVLGNREIRTLAGGTRNLWPDHQVQSNGETITIKADKGYNDLMVGDWVDGQVHAFDTTPYKIDGKVVTGYKCVVLATENPLMVAAKALIKNGGAPIDSDGLVYRLQNQPAAPKPPSGNDKPAGEGTNPEPETIVEAVDEP